MGCQIQVQELGWVEVFQLIVELGLEEIKFPKLALSLLTLGHRYFDQEGRERHTMQDS